MSTPIYKGKGQPASNGGWLAGVGSWFSGSAPAYAGRGQITGSSGYFGGATPAYKPAPSRTDGAGSAPDAVADAAECPVEPERITVLIPRELIEPQQSE